MNSYVYPQKAKSYKHLKEKKVVTWFSLMFSTESLTLETSALEEI
jgi:hypothetical protein